MALIMRIRAQIQKWGNGLGLRVSGALREVPDMQVGTEVDIEIHEDGFTVTKTVDCKKLRFTEAELLQDIDENTDLASELPKLSGDDFDV